MPTVTPTPSTAISTYTPTPTIAFAQRESHTTFYIIAGNKNDTFDQYGKAILKSHQVRRLNIITLDKYLNGSTVEVPIGTLIFLQFSGGQININPPRGIVEYAPGTYNLSSGDIGILKVIGEGNAVITVTTTN